MFYEAEMQLWLHRYSPNCISRKLKRLLLFLTAAIAVGSSNAQSCCCCCCCCWNGRIFRYWTVKWPKATWITLVRSCSALNRGVVECYFAAFSFLFFLGSDKNGKNLKNLILSIYKRCPEYWQSQKQSAKSVCISVTKLFWSKLQNFVSKIASY